MRCACYYLPNSLVIFLAWPLAHTLNEGCGVLLIYNFSFIYEVIRSLFAFHSYWSIEILLLLYFQDENDKKTKTAGRRKKRRD